MTSIRASCCCSLSAAVLVLFLSMVVGVRSVSAQSSPEAMTPCGNYSNQRNTTYPNQAQICAMFESLTGVNANASAFFANVLENVDWTIEGTHPLAGQYHNRTILEAAFARIDATGAEGSPLVLSLIAVIGGGDEQYSVQELQVLGTCIDGLAFNNRYAWVTRWNTDGKIIQVRAYLDSALVAKAIVGNEIAFNRYSDQINAISPFQTLKADQLGSQAIFAQH